MSTPPSSELPAPEYVADDRAAHALTPSQLDACRPQLLRVCYRMLDSMADAEDAVQDAMLRAWKARESFAGRSSRETWLTSIAVRVTEPTHEFRKSSARAMILHSVLGPRRQTASSGSSIHPQEPVHDSAVPHDICEPSR